MPDEVLSFGSFAPSNAEVGAAASGTGFHILKTLPSFTTSFNLFNPSFPSFPIAIFSKAATTSLSASFSMSFGIMSMTALFFSKYISNLSLSRIVCGDPETLASSVAQLSRCCSSFWRLVGLPTFPLGFEVPAGMEALGSSTRIECGRVTGLCGLVEE